MRQLAMIGAKVGMVMVVAAVAGAVGARVGDVEAPPIAFASGSVGEPRSLADGAAQVRRSTVAVRATWTEFGADGLPEPGRMEGSGFVFDVDGLIATNAHVISDAGLVQVVLPGGVDVEAAVVGIDAEHDLAVLAVDVDDLVPVVIARSATLRVGEPIAVLGDALGRDEGLSVRAGVVAGLDRHIVTASGRRYDGLIELDLTLTGGQSGGPVFDRSGAVIGIATAGQANGTGVGFAIGMDAAMPILDDLGRGR